MYESITPQTVNVSARIGFISGTVDDWVETAAMK